MLWHSIIAEIVQNNFRTLLISDENEKKSKWIIHLKISLSPTCWKWKNTIHTIFDHFVFVCSNSMTFFFVYEINYLERQQCYVGKVDLKSHERMDEWISIGIIELGESRFLLLVFSLVPLCSHERIECAIFSVWYFFSAFEMISANRVNVQQPVKANRVVSSSFLIAHTDPPVSCLFFSCGCVTNDKKKWQRRR